MPKPTNFQNLATLIAPSPLSGVFCVSLAAATVAINQVDMIRQFLRLPDSAVVQTSVAQGADTFLTSVLGQSRTDVVVVGAFWAVVGLGVYIFLHVLAQYITEIDDDLAVRHFVWPKGADRGRPFRMMIERTLFRAIALVGLILLIIGPLAATFKGPLVVESFDTHQITQYIGSFLVSLLLWHVVVVLLRLVMLRTRLIN